MLDSVSAIVEKLSYDFLRWSSFEEFQEESGGFSTFVEKQTFEKIKGRMKKGCGLGEPTIRSYAGDNVLTEKDVRASIDTLKATGEVQVILDRVGEVIAAELEIEAEAAEAEAERLRVCKRFKDYNSGHRFDYILNLKILSRLNISKTKKRRDYAKNGKGNKQEATAVKWCFRAIYSKIKNW